jgi:hypothetical protein
MGERIIGKKLYRSSKLSSKHQTDEKIRKKKQRKRKAEENEWKRRKKT